MNIQPGRRGSPHRSSDPAPVPAWNEEPAPPAELLICERCGYTEQVPILVDEDGARVDSAIRIATDAALPILCSGCAGDEQAAEAFYRSCGCA